MKIGIYTEIYKPVLNGVVISVESFRQQLEALGHEVLIFTPSYMEYSDPSVLTFHSLPLPTSTPYRLTIPFPAGARAEMPWRPPRLDVVHAQSPFATGLLAHRHAKQQRIPLIFTYHTRLVDYSHYLPVPGVNKSFLVWVSRTFSNMADRVVVPSQPIKELLEGYGVRTPIDVVPTRVRLEAADATAVRAVRERNRIPSDAHVLLNVGRLAAEKNVELLLEAFAASGASREWTLILVGDGPLRGQMEARATELGILDRVRFAGFVDRGDIGAYYAAADLFAFTSLSETQGLVVDEALQSGLPVVAIARGGVIDLLQRSAGARAVVWHDDRAAQLAAFTAALRELTSDAADFEELRRRARAAAGSTQADDSVHHLLSIYQAAMAQAQAANARRDAGLSGIERLLSRRL